MTAASPSERDAFQILLDYQQRSLAYGSGLAGEVASPAVLRGVGYRVGSRRLLSSFEEVVEVIALPSVLPVPGAQAWLLGIVNLRGRLLPVIDLRQFLEGVHTARQDGQRVIVARQPGGDVVLVIDEIYGQRSFEQSLTVEDEEPPEGRYTHFVSQRYRVGGERWGVFSIDLLVRTPEFRQAAA